MNHPPLDPFLQPIDPLLQALVDDIDYHGLQVERVDMVGDHVVVVTSGELECVDPGFRGFIEGLWLPEATG
jgi:hypothetical protein